MKICFIGLGSIGIRHLRNLWNILDHQELRIDALRRNGAQELSSDIKKIIQNVYYNFEELPSDYDIIFITNPTFVHFYTIQKAVKHTQHMFIEKPVFQYPIDSLDGLDLNSDGIYYVASPLRYNPIIKKLKESIMDEKVYSVRAICSSYLPEWRKGIDYRDNYSAHKNMGGGVALDLIHEMDYITYLFGLPKEMRYYGGKFSHLEIDSDDLATYLLKYDDKIVEIHLDYFGKQDRRKIELYCKDYVIVGDLLKNTLEYCTNEKITSVDLEEDQDYIDELAAFLNMIKGKKENDNSIEHANEILKLALDRR